MVYTALTVYPGQQLLLTLVGFGTSVRLYSIYSSVSSSLETEFSGSGLTDSIWSGSDDVMCVMAFIGENDELVLVSNIAQ